MTAIAPHLVPVIYAARHHGVGLQVIEQQAEDFAIHVAQCKRPFIALIGDDTDYALGPDQYNRKTFARLISKADAVAVVSSAPPMGVYSSLSALAAGLRLNAVIIETRPEQEIAWTKAVQAAKPDVQVLLCTVKGTRQ